MKTLTLAPGKGKLPLLHHPWVFKGAIAKNGGAEGGEIVRVAASDGRFIASGYYNPRSQIAVRLLSWDENESIDDAWIATRVREAVARRTVLRKHASTDAVRLIYSEADFLPGLIVDQYADVIVIEILTLGMEQFRDAVVDALAKECSPKAIFERVDGDARDKEGFSAGEGVRFGSLPPSITIRERERVFGVDVTHGQKTGYFLDQRENRRVVSSLAQGRVLDCFCYTGGFSLAIAPNADVTAVDSSADALVQFKKNAALDNIMFPEENIVCTDVFEYLRKASAENSRFDTIVLDPPKLAPSKSSIHKALRAYKDVNLFAMKSLNPGGLLATFSCSGGVSREDFRTALAWAAKDAGRELQFIGQLSQAEDHPVRASFPESEYLKGYVCRVI